MNAPSAQHQRRSADRSHCCLISKSRQWRNAAIDAIAKTSRCEWKEASGYHRRSLVENLMYRLKTLTGPCLWARKVDSQATEVSIRAGVLNRMAALARPHSVRID